MSNQDKITRLITAMFFSPTGTSAKITRAAAAAMGKALEVPVKEQDLTSPAARGKPGAFGPHDVLVLGLPVYGGRIPDLLEAELAGLSGNDTEAVILAIYGNRDFDDALLEMKDMLEARGFRIACAGTFIGEHSFTKKLAPGRPDSSDLEKAAQLGTLAAEKLAGPQVPLTIPGNRPYKERGPAFALAPATSEACTSCMACIRACPTGAISEDPHITDAQKCIRCCACIKLCPAQAKSLEHPAIAKTVAYLESSFTEPKQPEFFV